ncbi:MAG: hypothetical protein KAI41_08350 [Hyphomicrobiaceae bacterium]|nr:hypothetical protein [Hyphomicrobiaceae bacterium]
MPHFDRVIGLAVVIAAGAFVSGCGDGQSKYTKIEPAHVESISGSKLKKITLTPKAIERLDVQTAVVRNTSIAAEGQSPTMRKVVPYSSVIYDTHGGTWVYISPKSRDFVRHEIDIDYIDGDNVVLKDGPPDNTTIAVIGVAELYGAEAGIGH